MTACVHGWQRANYLPCPMCHVVAQIIERDELIVRQSAEIATLKAEVARLTAEREEAREDHLRVREECQGNSDAYYAEHARVERLERALEELLDAPTDPATDIGYEHMEYVRAKARAELEKL